MLSTIAKTIKDISYFFVLLAIFIFIYDLLGLELFSYKVKFNSANEVDMGVDGVYPEANFNGFFMAFLTVFIVLTGDSWTLIYH